MLDKQFQPYEDLEVQAAVQAWKAHPIMQAILNYAFKEDAITMEQKLQNCVSIKSFQTNIIYPALQRILAESSTGLTSNGFEQLDSSASYLFISNHRDIVLDASLLNVLLYEKNCVMTASAIGDNLIPNDFLHAFSKLNRNFIVQRSLAPRELLRSSAALSKYMRYLLDNSRSVWLAQKEGRTKDGNDITQQGVLKMLSMSKSREMSNKAFFKSLRIVPVSISYELDPTFALKLPALITALKNEPYTKKENEDLQNIITGLTGSKGQIHMEVGQVLTNELDLLDQANGNKNQEIKLLADILTKRIQEQYYFHPSNYVAYDLLRESADYNKHYSTAYKESFTNQVDAIESKFGILGKELFLKSYANPIINKLNIGV